MGSGLSMTSVNKIKELANAKEYSLALDIVDTQDLTKSLNPQFLRLCAEIFVKNHRLEDARKSLILARKLGPESKRVLLSCLDLYLRMGFFDLAKTYYDMYMFEIDEFGLEANQGRYLWMKHEGKDAKELEEYLEPFAQNLDYDWSFELFLLYKLQSKDREAKNLSDLYLASFKQGANPDIISDIQDNKKTAEEYFNIFATEEQPDTEESSEMLRREEQKLLEADELRMHPKEAEITIMYEEQIVDADADKKAKKLLKKQEKEDKKAAHKQKKEDAEPDSEAGAFDESKDAQKSGLFKKLFKKKDADESDSEVTETEETKSKEAQATEAAAEEKAAEAAAEEEATEEAAEEVTEKPVEEAVEEVAWEPAEETVEEVTEEPAEETVEEVTEEPAEETAEEVTEEPAKETAEEVTEEPANEIAEETEESSGAAEQVNELDEKVEDAEMVEDTKIEEYIDTSNILDAVIVVDDDDGFEAEADTVEELVATEAPKEPEKKKPAFVFQTVELAPEELEDEFEVDDFSQTVDDGFGEMADFEEDAFESYREPEPEENNFEKALEAFRVPDYSPEEEQETEPVVAEEPELEPEIEPVVEEEPEIEPEIEPVVEEEPELEPETEPVVEEEPEIEPVVEEEPEIEPETEPVVEEEPELEPEIEPVVEEEPELEPEIEPVVEEEPEIAPETEPVVEEEPEEELEIEFAVEEKPEIEVAPFSTRPQKKKLDYPVFRSSLFPNYHKEVKEVENNFDDIVSEAQDKMSENMLKEEQMQKEAEALLASLGIDISDMKTSTSSFAPKKEQTPKGPSRDEIKSSLKIDSVKKDILKKLKGNR